MFNRVKYLKAIGQNIKHYREKRGYSQDELAKRCGYNSDNSRTTINKIENGKSDFPTSKLTIIANALNVSVLDLLDIPENLFMEIETNNGIAVQVNNANATYNNNTFDQKVELLNIYDNLNMRGKTELLLAAYEIRDKYDKV